MENSLSGNRLVQFMTEDYSSSDLTWGIALHAGIGIALGIGIFIQGLIDDSTLILTFLGVVATAPLLAVLAAMPVGIINGKKIVNSMAAIKCSALSCGIGFLAMWGAVVIFLLLSVEILTDNSTGDAAVDLLYYMFLAPAGVAMGAVAAWVSNTMVFHSSPSPVVATAQPQAAITAQQTTGALAPSYVATANTVQGGRDLYDWEIAEKKHEDRLGKIPRF